MPRSGAEARRRLHRAALELYDEQGYEKTTTAQIAARAGVSERTFFWHFADKREVVFDAEPALQAALADAIDKVPAEAAPLEAVRQALRAVTPALVSDRSLAELQYRVISASPALHERELAKLAALSEVVAGALRTRALSERQAALAAQTGMTAFLQAAQTWIVDPSADLDELIVGTFAELAELVNAPMSQH